MKISTFLMVLLICSINTMGQNVTGKIIHYIVVKNNTVLEGDAKLFDPKTNTIKIPEDGIYTINLLEIKPFDILGKIFLNDKKIVFPKNDKPDFNLKKGDIIKLIASKKSRYELFITEVFEPMTLQERPSTISCPLYLLAG